MIHVGRKMDGVCNRNSTAKSKLDVRIGFPVAFVVFVVENDGVSGTWVVLLASHASNSAVSKQISCRNK
jgi:hypothetical protein